jgi:DNA-binding response OmpR family regulator
MVARLQALLRRHSRQERGMQVLEHEGLRRDVAHHSVTLRGECLDLGSEELGLLWGLQPAGGSPVSREHLLASVWHYDYAPDSRTVDNHEMALRWKIEADPTNPRYVLTVRGVGYRPSLDLLEPAAG